MTIAILVLLVFLPVMASDILYLYWAGVWYDPIKAIEIAEICILVALIIAPILVIVKILHRDKEMLDKNHIEILKEIGRISGEVKEANGAVTCGICNKQVSEDDAFILTDRNWICNLGWICRKHIKGVGNAT